MKSGPTSSSSRWWPPISSEAHRFPWTNDPGEARVEQLALKNRLVTASLDLSGVDYAMAVGVSYSEQRGTAVAVAATTLLSGQLLDPGNYYSTEVATGFPYIPGLFAYREGPAICALLDSLPGLPPPDHVRRPGHSPPERVRPGCTYRRAVRPAHTRHDEATIVRASRAPHGSRRGHVRHH